MTQIKAERGAANQYARLQGFESLTSAARFKSSRISFFKALERDVQGLFLWA